MSAIDKIRKDPRVTDVWNEGEDGWWISLVPGWINAPLEFHGCHEWSVKDLVRSFADIRPCACDECKS
jgi:hypothetical protein